MKILDIEIKNFKPFDLVSLPNNGDIHLSDGLFIIQGENSMGKTSLIESILWGIFGENVMAKKDRSLIVKSGKNDCQVKVTFELGGIVYRIIRKVDRYLSQSKETRTNSYVPNKNPIQSKMFGNGIHFEYKSGAILFKKENDKFHQVCRGTTLVNKEISSIIGIDPEVIEKTVYIRQKEVDMLSLADPGELRDLLKDLFNLNEFDDNIKEHLKAEVSNLHEDIKELKVKLGHLVSERSELIRNENLLKDKKRLLKIKQDEISCLKKELSKYPSFILIENISTQMQILNKLKIDNNVYKQLYEKEKEHFDSQEKRIIGLKDKIEDLNYKIVTLYTLLQNNHVELNIIKMLRNEIISIENEASNLRKVINNHRLTDKNKRNTDLSKDFYLLVDDIHSVIETFFNAYVINDKIITRINNIHTNVIKTKKKYIEIIQKLEIDTKDLLSQLEEQKKILSSNQLLGEIKQKSILYINDNAKCPVCKNTINSKEKLIFEIKTEKTRIVSNEKVITENIKELSELYENKSLILNSEQKVYHLFEFLEPQLSNLFERFSRIENEFGNKNILTKDHESFSLKPSLLDKIISKKIQEESNLCSFQQLVENFSDELESLLIKQNEMNVKIDDLKRRSEETSLNIMDIEKQINQYCSELHFYDITSLLTSFNVTNIEELNSKIKNLNLTIDERQQIAKNIGDDIDYIQNDILKRNERIEELVLSETTLKEKEKRLRHMQFLIGEIDGFFSSYVVEERLASVLAKTTNYYLTRFTNGRYEVNGIHSTMKKMKDRISHGLIITLFDNFDMIEKTKDQISGGDETALGLALRIAISKLMGNIRPFKNIDNKAPMLNFIIMDEPLTGIDENRRNIIMDILTKDNSFKQIFFISHENIGLENFNSIIVDSSFDNDNVGRTVTYNFFTSRREEKE